MSEKQNYCETSGMMSTCTAKNCKEQEECKFYERASRDNRCMNFAFDEYCDNVNAQIDAKKK